MSRNKVDINFINTNMIKPLSSNKTKELIKLYKSGQKEKLEEASLGNLKLVLSVVNRYNKRKTSLDDLFQVGFLGLIKSIENFDLSLDVAFSTYAVPMIEGEIKRYLRDDSTLRVSRQVRDLSFRILKLKEENMQEFSKSLSIDEIATTLNENKIKVIEAIDANMPLTSLDEPLFVDYDDSLLLEDTLYSLDEDRKLDYSYLYEGIDNLSSIERKVILERYFNGKSQLDLAKILNISQAQVSRIEKSGLKNLKKYV